MSPVDTTAMQSEMLDTRADQERIILEKLSGVLAAALRGRDHIPMKR